MAVLTTDAEIHAVVEAAKHEPKTIDAIDARYIADSDVVAVAFDNGIEVRFPRRSIEAIDNGLQKATPEQLAAVQIIGGGSALAWDEPFLAIGIGELMHGFPRSCREMARIGAIGGAKTSLAKTAAVRLNGKKGGRPRTRANSA